MKGFMGKILLLQLSCPPAEDYNVALHRGPTLQIFTANCSREFLQPICLESEQLSSYLEVESPPNSPMIKCVKKKKKCSECECGLFGLYEASKFLCFSYRFPKCV